MIVFLQFPLADIRLFVGNNTGKLALPFWPSPSPYREFVRAFGSIKPRGKGGVRGWIGESEICDAGRAVRFVKLSVFRDQYSRQTIEIRCSSRHFYFDGLAVGKYELVLITKPSTLTLSYNSLRDFISHILHLPVIIPAPYGEPVQARLLSAAEYLARLYLFSSSSTDSRQIIWDKEWIIPGMPVILIECSDRERVTSFPGTRSVTIPDRYGMEVQHWWSPSRDKNTRVWLLKYQSRNERSIQIGRTLRLYLMRLHAEHECLRSVLKCVDSGEISPQNGTEGFHVLQYYLNEATRRIAGINHKASKRYETDDIGDLAHVCLDAISPGRRDSLLQKLRLLQIRPQVFRKVERFVNQMIMQEQVMGDKYTVGQAGAVGPGSHAHDMAFNQIWKQTGDAIDLSVLASELPELRSKLKEEATDAEHDAAIGEVASAEVAAKKGDGPAVMEHLAKAGKWAFEVATKIGVTVSAAALKTALGL